MEKPLQDDPIRDALEDRHDYESWAGTTDRDENAFFLNLLLTGSEVPGWELAVERPAVRDGPVVSRSWFWASSDHEDALVRVHGYECPSLDFAHEQLLRLLGEFQGPVLRRSRDGPGDVAFVVGEGNAVVAARGNLALRFLNAGPRAVGLDDFAGGLDRHLVRPPEPDPDRDAIPGPRIEELRLEGQPDPHEEAEMVVSARDPLEGEFGWRIYSPGRVRRDDGTLRYSRSSAGAETLRVVVVNEAGGVTSRSLRLEPVDGGGGPAGRPG